MPLLMTTDGRTAASESFIVATGPVLPETAPNPLLELVFTSSTPRVRMRAFYGLVNWLIWVVVAKSVPPSTGCISTSPPPNPNRCLFAFRNAQGMAEMYIQGFERLYASASPPSAPVPRRAIQML